VARSIPTDPPATPLKDVAATNHNGNFNAKPGNFCYFVHHANDGVTVDAKLVVPHQSLA
jgi:hypothetical protein